MHEREGKSMRKGLIAMGIIGALALPGAAMAADSDTDATNAAKECRTEQGTTDATREAFALKYGTNDNHANAFGKCVSSRARDEKAEHKAARKAARRACKPRKHGKGHAYGRCLAKKQKAFERKADSEDRQEIQSEHNAARKCAEERDAKGKDAFGQEHGTNKNKRNAFGKCVSNLARSG
jgi:hypothetical protein